VLTRWNLVRAIYREAITHQYVGLLTAIAAHTIRVSASVIAEAAKQQFKCSPLVAQKFGSAVSRAMAHCMKSGRNATSGRKLSHSVRAVCLVLANRDPRLHALRDPHIIT
jgi:hypothetical protein